MAIARWRASRLSTAAAARTRIGSAPRRGAPSPWTSSSIRASSCSPSTASPCRAARSPTTVDEAVAAAEQIGYPCAIKAQVLIGGRGKAGGIKIAQDASEAARVRRRDPRHGHRRPARRGPVPGRPGLDRGRLRHRRRVLRLGDPRPRREEAAGDGLRQGRDGHRGGRRRGPRGAGQSPHRPDHASSTPPRRGDRRRRRARRGRRSTRPPRCWSSWPRSRPARTPT